MSVVVYRRVVDIMRDSLNGTGVVIVRRFFLHLCSFTSLSCIRMNSNQYILYWLFPPPTPNMGDVCISCMAWVLGRVCWTKVVDDVRRRSTTAKPPMSNGESIARARCQAISNQRHDVVHGLVTQMTSVYNAQISYYMNAQA